MISCREEGHGGGQGTDVCVCVPSQGGDWKQSALDVASENGLAGTVECLVAAGAKMPDITDENKNELLLRCAHLGAASRLPALLQAGADPAHTDTNGKTGLWLACEIKDEATAAVLMEETKGAGALNLQVTKEACLGVWWGAGG